MRTTWNRLGDPGNVHLVELLIKLVKKVLVRDLTDGLAVLVGGFNGQREICIVCHLKNLRYNNSSMLLILQGDALGAHVRNSMGGS